jgi:hypothetical protein
MSGEKKEKHPPWGISPIDLLFYLLRGQQGRYKGLVLFGATTTVFFLVLLWKPVERDQYSC